MRKTIPYITLSIVSLFIIIPFVASVSVNTATDLSRHYRYALELPNQVHVAHVLYYASVLIFDELIPNASAFSVNVFAMITFMSPLLLILFALLKRAANGYVKDSAILVLAFCLFIFAPISIFKNGFYMTRYVNSVVWHSPTYHALRLFIVPVSLLTLRIIDGSRYRDLNQRVFFVLLTACLISLSTLAKPNYSIALVPGLGLLVIYRVIKRQTVDWALLFLGVMLPGIVVLALQYLVNFGNGDGGVQLGLFVLLRRQMPVWQIPVRLMLSLAFPLSVYLLYFAEARRSTYLNMSWLIFLVGLTFMYFVNVTGWRFDHFVFYWTGYSVMFVLTYASAQFLVERYAAERRCKLRDGESVGRSLSPRAVLVASIFVLHVIFGIIYYFRFLAFPV